MPAETESVQDALINWPQFPFSQQRGCVPAARTTMPQPLELEGRNAFSRAQTTHCPNTAEAVEGAGHPQRGLAA